MILSSLSHRYQDTLPSIIYESTLKESICQHLFAKKVKKTKLRNKAWNGQLALFCKIYVKSVITSSYLPFLFAISLKILYNNYRNGVLK